MQEARGLELALKKNLYNLPDITGNVRVNSATGLVKFHFLSVTQTENKMLYKLILLAILVQFSFQKPAKKCDFDPFSVLQRRGCKYCQGNVTFSPDLKFM